MKVEIEVKYNIGDIVLVKDTSGNGIYSKHKFPFKAAISGYTITKDSRKTTVYYFIEPIADSLNQWQIYDLTKATSHRRRYPAKWLEKAEE